MTTRIHSFRALESFRCLGAECPDTCCRGWEMPADDAQCNRYRAEAPELLDTVDLGQGIMRRDASTHVCAQLCEGLCSIHARYGEALLGDACYFYPRLLHRLGDRYVMGGASSCPEMLRLMLTLPDAFARTEIAVPRLPQQRRNLVPDAMRAEDVEAQVMQALACAGEQSRSPEENLDALLAMVLGPHLTLPAPESKPGDAHALYYALALTEAFGKPGTSTGLPQIMQAMEQALDCRFDRTTRQLTFGPKAGAAYPMLVVRWRQDAARALAEPLRRWLQAQVVMTMFPFGGFADATPIERAAVLVQRFATVTLALMCHVEASGVAPDEATVLRVMQGISRFQDHLADINLTRMIHHDSGWESIARLRGLIYIASSGLHAGSDASVGVETSRRL